jgi:putative ABC transport system permease protein
MQGTARAANRPDASIYAHLGFIDHDFLNVFDVKVIAGRGFSEEFTGDTSVCLINRKAAESLGFTNPDEAIDVDLIVRVNHSKVVGVVENFNFTGLQMGFEPMVLELDPGLGGNFLNVHLGGGAIAPMVQAVERNVRATFPDFPFEYQFLDEVFQRQYGEDKKFGALFTFFSAIALFLACLGLFGVAAYMAQQRAKEIAIRKVLGSNVWQVFVLLNREYIFIAALAYLCAIPVAYLTMEKWLEAYHNRIGIAPWMMLVPFLLVELVILLVTASQTYTAARANPTRKLRE